LAVWPKADGKLSYLDFTSDGPVAKTGLRRLALRAFGYFKARLTQRERAEN
jgi:hypothetical protein